MVTVTIAAEVVTSTVLGEKSKETSCGGDVSGPAGGAVVVVVDGGDVVVVVSGAVVDVVDVGGVVVVVGAAVVLVVVAGGGAWTRRVVVSLLLSSLSSWGMRFASSTHASSVWIPSWAVH